MEIDVIGVVAIACGLIGWLAGPVFAAPVFFVATLLSSSAAILLPSLGNANIQPAHLLLGFFAVAALASRGAVPRVGAALAFPGPGFWLLLTAVYAALSAYFLPRIFGGATYAFAIARTELGPGIIAEPLAPSTGNITQPVYFIGDLVCFLMFRLQASRPGGLIWVVNAALIAAAVNLAFAAIDLASYWAGLGDLLAFLRNGSYRMLDEAAVLGFKRIVGSFPEASTFAYFTAGFFAFSLKLWLNGIRREVAGPLALASLAALLFATSSTGYAATFGFLVLLFVTSLVQVLTRPVTRRTLVLVTVLPLMVGGMLVAMRLSQPVWAAVNQMLDQTVFYKMASSSGIERAQWNAQALRNFTDTGGLGGGAGSVRASSFPIAVLGNIGVFGALTYGLFIGGTLLARRRRWTAPYPAACQSAARWACVAQLVGASVAGSFIDLGLPFFIFAGLACAGPEPARVARPAAAVPGAAVPAG